MAKVSAADAIRLGEAIIGAAENPLGASHRLSGMDVEVRGGELRVVLERGISGSVELAMPAAGAEQPKPKAAKPKPAAKKSPAAKKPAAKKPAAKKPAKRAAAK